ncbi:hypothetical protein [Anaerovibrio sp.]|uniref:hypothetical protein n=1 Tax=Anaerovibrio sp. TaxID=1872532 RepID=UPI0025BBDB26|nr:hypothetical protein [Anaerovibrio sp.]MBR2142588.1 hypothetical protein [Anaerovibrio sp.]
MLQITRLGNIGKGKAVLIAGAVAWSAFFCSFGNVNSAAAASAVLLGKAGILTEGIRLAGVPYRNRNGKIVISGSASQNDNILSGCNERAQVAYNMAKANEPRITLDMLDIAHRLGTSMDGLEYSVKTASSVVSKIERKTDKALQAGETPKKDFEYVSETGDLLRYTQVVNHDEIAAKVRATVKLLEDKGYTVDEIDNKYLNEEGRYKAVHLNVTSPSGQHFEMQIHSPESLAASRATHTMYEEWRRPETSEERKAELFTMIKSTYDSMPLPKDIMSLQSYKRVG